MPTVLIEAGFRFHFFSADGHEPPHIHVDKDGRRAKVWLADVRIAKSGGFNDADIRRMIDIIQANRQRFLEAWNEFFL
jgi:hypothetical protein